MTRIALFTSAALFTLATACTHDLGKPLDLETETSANRRLARKIACEIRATVARGDRVWDKDEKAWRPARWQDFELKGPIVDPECEKLRREIPGHPDVQAIESCRLACVRASNQDRRSA